MRQIKLPISYRIVCKSFAPHCRPRQHLITHFYKPDTVCDTNQQWQSIYTNHMQSILKIPKRRLNGSTEHKPERIHAKSLIHSRTIEEENGKCSFKQQGPVHRPVSVKSKALQREDDTNTAQNRTQHEYWPKAQ